ncbi:MAG: T9SS type A sorting domain-containing protein [Lewinellaceae bacterium]|nr:T9SS type A sorting domain-containing protein [Saprospiraceae bacterium]MCB9343798.1 T9SS type A sorting domain-containing protein [Lewinellaceae bacterium]
MQKTNTLLFALLFIVHIVQGQNQNISNGNVFEGEPFLAVNPANPQNLVVAWMGFVLSSGVRPQIKTRSSYDGGNTWSDIVIMPHIQNTYQSADPTMAFDENGNLFLAYIDYQKDPDEGAVFLFKSVNGGLNWTGPTEIINADADGTKLPIDRPWLTINETGQHLYLTTKPAPWVPAPNRPYFCHSGDGGQSWSSWQYLDGPGHLVGNLIAAPMAAPAATGQLFFAAYPTYLFTQSIYPQYQLAKSSDFGNNFEYSEILSGTNPSGNDSAKLAYKLLVNPANDQHLVFIYPYQPAGDIDIMMTETFDQGTNWSSPVKVNDDPLGNGKMQDMIWGDFGADGDLVISWRDRRNGTEAGYADGSDFYAAYRNKDSLNFSPNIKLSDLTVDYHNILSQSGNDFMGVSLIHDTIYAVWGNTRDGSLDIWFTKKAVASGTSSTTMLLGSESLDMVVYPNPSTGIYRIEYNDTIDVDLIRIFDQKGRLVRTLENPDKQTTIDLSGFANGIYLLECSGRSGTVSRIIEKW